MPLLGRYLLYMFWVCRIFSEDFTSPLPIKEETLKNVLEVAMSTIQSYLKNASYLSQAKEINKSSKTGDLESSLKILSSMFVAVNTSANIRRLTLIIQKVSRFSIVFNN